MAIDASPFQVVQIRPPLMERGKISHKLARTDILGATVQVVTTGGETNLHAHAAVDSFWLVLDGEVTFYTTGDEVVARMSKNEGMLIPRGTPYWFESSGEMPLVILHFSARAQNEENKRIDYTPRRKLPREVAEGKFFEG